MKALHRQQLPALLSPSRASGARHQDLLATAFLALVVLVLIGRAPLTGAVLAPTDALFVSPFFADEKPPGFGVPGNPMLIDVVYQIVPWRWYAWGSLRAGHLPFWNPYSHAGAPFVATMQSALFYPIYLLLLWLPFEQTFAWSAILKLWIAGTLTYLLARRYRLDWQASLVSALAFMLSGYVVVWLGYSLTNVAVWLPGVILLDELLLTAESAAERLRYAALLAIVVAVQFTGGHPETCADVLVAGTMYHVLRWSQVIAPSGVSWGTKLGRLILLPALAVLLGAALASIQLLPFLEWLPLSAEYRSRGAESGFQLVRSGFWRYLFFLPLALFPNLYGNPAWPLPPHRSLLPWGQNYNEDALYVGIIPLLLAVVGLLASRRRTPVLRVWAVLATIALGRALHFPVIDWISQLPVLNLGNPHRERLVWSLSVALLAAFGAQALCASEDDRWPRLVRDWRRLNLAVVSLGVLLAFMGVVILPLAKPRLIAAARHAAEAEFARAGGYPLSLYYQRADEAVSKLLWSFRPANVSMYLPALIALAALAGTMWVLRRPTQRRSALSLLLVSLTALDLTAFAWSYNPIVPRAAFYPPSKLASRVAQDSTLFRFSATGVDLFPDAQMMYGLSDVRSFDFSTKWYKAYVMATPEARFWSAYSTIFTDFESPLLRVLNLKYIFAGGADSPAPGVAADVVSSTSAGRLWRLRAVQPRSFVVADAVIARNDSDAVRILKQSPEAVYQRVILSRPAPPPVSTAHPDSSALSGSGVTVVRYEPDRSDWQVRLRDFGYLVTTDAYYPGWRAYVDGIESPIYRANLAFRALRLSPGDHRVEYRYEPGWLPLAVALEFLSALVVVAGLAISGALVRKARGHRRDRDSSHTGSTAPGAPSAARSIGL